MADQIRTLYDAAMKDWVNTNFASLLSPKTMHLLVGTPDRAFAEYVTPTGIAPDGRAPLPRIAITCEDPERDEQRFNSCDIRKLGYVEDSDYRQIYKAEYPIPMRLPYTINFWTEYRREMTLYMQQVMKLFRFQYTYLTVDLDLVSDVAGLYGEKDIGLYLDSSIMNTGDLEPGQKERITRRTINVHLNAWLWDIDPATPYTVKEVEFKYYTDEDLTELLETNSTPQRQTLYTAAGAVDYTGNVDEGLLPIIARSFIMDATFSGSVVRSFDDGAGGLIGDQVDSGTIDYVTGAISVTFKTAPDVTTDVEVAYFTTTE